MNKVTLIGNLTKDVDYGSTGGGTSYARFTLAINRSYKNANGERECDFINCIAWRTLADRINQYCVKGNKVGVNGSLQVRTYDGNDGTKRYVTEVLVDECEFLTPKDSSSGGYNNNNSSYQPQKPKLELVNNDDLPF